MPRCDEQNVAVPGEPGRCTKELGHEGLCVCLRFSWSATGLKSRVSGKETSNPGSGV